MRRRHARTPLRPFRAWPVALLAACSICSVFTLPIRASELRRDAIVRAVERNRSAIVNIDGQKTLSAAEDPSGRVDSQRRVNGMGSGVIIDERGYIITNQHVIEGVRNIRVTMANGKSHIAQPISTDPKSDLAIIKINTGEDLPVINIGASHDLMPGEPVIAVGNAYGYEHTVTRGIISALHRDVQVSDVQGYEDLIQTDASINPGNSGGPLFNIDGEMIGINVAVRVGAQGIGFAIPVDRVTDLAARLLSVERVDKNWHGITASRTPPGQRGAVVDSVAAGSPAAELGLTPGDVITIVGDRKIARPLDLERALLDRKAGDDVTMVVDRDRRSMNMNLALASFPKSAAPTATTDDPTWELLGLRLTPVPAAQFQQNQSRYRGGLNVTAVRPGSPAAKQGIRRGDVLVGMHIWETVTLENVAYVLNRPDFADIEPLKFYILRGNETLYGHLPVSMQRR